MAGGKSLVKIFNDKPWLITLGLAGVLILVIALALVGISLKPEAEKIEIIESESEIGTTVIFVDVGGAVIKPGIYELGPEARVNDALIVAGGVTKDADRDWISQNVNLAAKLTDGAKIYIPFQDEFNTNKDSPSQSKGESLNINTASLSALDHLWGIGPPTPPKI